MGGEHLACPERVEPELGCVLRRRNRDPSIGQPLFPLGGPGLEQVEHAGLVVGGASREGCGGTVVTPLERVERFQPRQPRTRPESQGRDHLLRAARRGRCLLRGRTLQVEPGQHEIDFLAEDESCLAEGVRTARGVRGRLRCTGRHREHFRRRDAHQGFIAFW